MNPFLTTYRKSYPYKVQCSNISKGVPQEFPDPLGEAFKNYLQLSSRPNEPVPPVEDCDEYFKKIEERKPKIATMHLKPSVDNPTLERVFIENGKSVYQIDYCDLVKDEQLKEIIRQKNLFRLPDDSYIPLTTHTYSYRDPVVINSSAYEKAAFKRTPNNLDPEHHIRAILKTTTGDSEYNGTLGKLGDIIMDEELHGKLDHFKCLTSPYYF